MNTPLEKLRISTIAIAAALAAIFALPQPGLCDDTVHLFAACINGLQTDINGVAAPGSSVTSIMWDWGDGTNHSGWFPQSHRYSSPGQYTVQVTANYKDGTTASSSHTVSVAPGLLSNCVALIITVPQGGSVSYNSSVGSATLSSGFAATLELDRADNLSSTATPASGNSFSNWSLTAKPTGISEAPPDSEREAPEQPWVGITGVNGVPIDANSASIRLVVDSDSSLTANFATTQKPAN